MNKHWEYMIEGLNLYSKVLTCKSIHIYILNLRRLYCWTHVTDLANQIITYL